MLDNNEIDVRKTGVNADKSEIASFYDPAVTEQFNAIDTALFGKMKEFNMDPQTIADGILELILQQVLLRLKW